MQNYYVYIMTNKSKTLYVGMTNNLSRRMYEHKSKSHKGFTSKYNINKLIYFEELGSKVEAIKREKQLKGWLRSKKVKLIEEQNPQWRDLSKNI